MKFLIFLKTLWCIFYGIIIDAFHVRKPAGERQKIQETEERPTD